MLWQGSVNHLGLIEGRRHCARPTNIYRYFMFPVIYDIINRMFGQCFDLCANNI